MKKNLTNVLLIIFLAAVVAVAALYLAQNFRRHNTTRILASQEVRNYEGKNLSSVNSIPENSIKGPQYVDKAKYRLDITGLVGNPQQLSYDEVLSKFTSYKKIVTLNCVEGWSVTILWEGILFRDLINSAKPRPEAKTVIFHAVDGYTTSFPIEYFFNNDTLLAYKMNGVTLTPDKGFPFQLVAENKWGYKWIKWIDKIEFSSDTNYQGYWEMRGYSNSGNLNENFLKRQ